jgi:hypothetical protein
MPKTRRSEPFKWSEIHSLAKTRIENLDSEIRAEISESVSPLPASTGARHQLFVLLEESANDWADRAYHAYMDCLREIGRIETPDVRSLIWSNGLRFFLTENIPRLVSFAAGIVQHEKVLQGSGHESGTPPKVRDLRIIAPEITTMVDRIESRMSVKVRWGEEGGSWLTQIRRLFDETALTVREEAESRFVEKEWGRIVPVPQYGVPLSEVFPKQPPKLGLETLDRGFETTAGSNPTDRELGQSSRPSTREILIKQVLADKGPVLKNYTTKRAAEMFEVSDKTIRNWIDEGKLSRAVGKRGYVSGESIRRLLEPKSESQVLDCAGDAQK